MPRPQSESVGSFSLSFFFLFSFYFHGSLRYFFSSSLGTYIRLGGWLGMDMVATRTPTLGHSVTGRVGQDLQNELLLSELVGLYDYMASRGSWNTPKTRRRTDRIGLSVHE